MSEHIYGHQQQLKPEILCGLSSTPFSVNICGHQIILLDKIHGFLDESKPSILKKVHLCVFSLFVGHPKWIFLLCFINKFFHILN